MSNYVEKYDVVINKITKAIYDEYVAAGIITQEMVENEAWVFADDQFLSADNLNKLLGIEAGAQVNIIDGLQLNGADLPVNAKKVNIVVPTKLSDLEKDINFVETESDPTVPAWAKEATKPSYAYDEITGKPDLFSGNYEDLAGKPELFSGDYNDLENKPTLFSGSYNDLADKPTIPSVDGLASEDYVDGKVAEVNTAMGNKANASDVYSKTEANNLLGNKVDKVTGKSLVSDTEITKLATVEANANNYVLPSDVVKDSAYVHTDNNYTANEKAKLEGIEAGANKTIIRIWS